MGHVRQVWGAAAFTARVLGVVSTVAIVVVACGRKEGSGAAAPLGTERSTVIQHEECAEAGRKVDAIDVTNDGKPDIRKVFADGREVCRVSDLNHEGHPDLYEYFDGQGQLRRREYDFDDNGLINRIDFYEAGRLVRSELDTTNQGRIDTWDTYDSASGKLVRRERDATGDGRVDQWWTYEGEKVTIAMDRNGDGRPEPDATLTMGEVAGGGADAGAARDAGPPAVAGSSAPPPPAPPQPTGAASGEPAPPVTTSDAGVPGKPQRGGAKR